MPQPFSPHYDLAQFGVGVLREFQRQLGPDVTIVKMEHRPAEGAWRQKNVAMHLRDADDCRDDWQYRYFEPAGGSLAERAKSEGWKAVSLDGIQQIPECSNVTTVDDPKGLALLVGAHREEGVWIVRADIMVSTSEIKAA